MPFHQLAIFIKFKFKPTGMIEIGLIEFKGSLLDIF